jgi:glucose/arabinose dehydrogenase
MRRLVVFLVVSLATACAGPTTMRPTASHQASSALPTPIATARATTSTGTTAPSGTAAPSRTSAPTSGTSTPAASASPPPEPTRSPSLDVTLTVEPFAELDSALTFFTTDGAAGHYAVGQEGLIYVVGLDGAVQQNPYLDLSDRIDSGGEQGLLGLAFHPDFAGNGRLYVNYTNTDGDTVISEFTEVRSGRDPGDNVVDSNSERILLTIQQPFANHNGGMIAFGPDGYLYIGMGDGGSGGDPMGNGQARLSLLGKMLRIDVDSGDPYGIPPDNPFVDSDALPEIWSMGLRNPWRWSFDRATGGMFIGDVGQAEVEEIDAEPAGLGGRNYGWNVMEGDQCYRTDPCDQTGLTLPVVANHRERGERAITGGYVYRGSEFPELQGLYIYSDWSTGELWAFDAAAALAGGAVEPRLVGETGMNPTSFGEDVNGELYVVGGRGTVARLVVERPRP